MHTIATVRNGKNQALVVVDVQVGVMADLNLAMTWLRYPGRHNCAVPLAEFDFAPPPTGG